MTRRHWLLSLSLLFSLLASPAWGNDPHAPHSLNITPGQDTYDLTGKALILKQPKEGNLTPSDLLADTTRAWQPLSSSAPNFSFSDRA
ncbi:hypothetical protein, partial [Marinimicrobium sp. UBA4209]